DSGTFIQAILDHRRYGDGTDLLQPVGVTGQACNVLADHPNRGIGKRPLGVCRADVREEDIGKVLERSGLEFGAAVMAPPRDHFGSSHDARVCSTARLRASRPTSPEKPGQVEAIVVSFKDPSTGPNDGAA